MQTFENNYVSKPLELTPQQQEVLGALENKETEEYPLSQWYIGALYALENYYNPDRIAQAAHSLRELLEKLPQVIHESDVHVNISQFKEKRDKINKYLSRAKKRYPNGLKGRKIDENVYKTLIEIEKYIELNNKPNRRERIKQAVANIDPMVSALDTEIQKAKRDQYYDLWDQLEGFAHHKPRSSIEEFSNCLNELETIVFDLLAPITAQDQQDIQTILNLPDKSDEDVNRMFSLIQRKGANSAFFFGQISENADVMWLPFLEKRGYFLHPPSIQRTDGNYVTYPFWWPIRYLEKISSKALNETIKIVEQLPKTDNPVVYDGILNIALQLTGKQSAKLIDKILEYTRIEHQWQTHRYAELLAHWTEENQTSAALKLAERLIAFVPDPQSEKKCKQRSDNTDDWREMIGTSLYPVPKYSQWDYSDIMFEGIRPLAEKEPYNVACLLIDTTVNMICLRTHRGELDKEEDYSDAWCNRVHGQDNEHEDPEKTLVHTLTFACKKVFERSPDKVAALDMVLRKPHWKIFKRLRHYLYTQYPNEETKPWIRELMLTHEDYGLWEHHYEFQQMIQSACEHFKETVLSKAERTRIFDAILDGPSKENQRHWVEDWLGEEFTEERFQERQQHFHWMQLRPFESVLFGKYETRFKKLQDKINKPISDEDYLSYEVKTGSVSNRSPLRPEDLDNRTDEKLLTFINEWEKEDEHLEGDSFVKINIQALANTFQTVFKESIIPDPSRLKFWMKNRERIEKPIYVRMMVYAMEALIKEKNFDQLNESLTFSEWVLSHPDREHGSDYKQDDESRENKNWSNARRAVGDFIGVCLEKETNVPITVQEQLIKILKLLCIQYDWNLDVNHLNGLYRKDPFTQGINNTRSRALDDLIKFGYWLRRHKPECDVTEIIKLLEIRFSSETDYPLTTAEYAILGKNYASIYNFNEKWAIEHKSDFFPQTQSKRKEWYAAFSSFILFNHEHKRIYEIFKDDFNFALQHLSDFKNHDLIGRQPINVFGEHIFTYYLWEMFPLKGEESLLERFYQKTTKKPEHWANLFKDIGHRLRKSGKHLDSNIKDRVKKFFEWRLEQNEPKELRFFSNWLDAECLETEWRLSSYSKVIDVTELERWEIRSNLKELCQMLPKHTAKVVECFAKLTDSIRDNIYIPTEESETILTAGINSRDAIVQKNAKRALDNLLRIGRSEFLKLKIGKEQ